jgi:hypothetical protein
MNADGLCALLSAYRFTVASEADLQAAVEQALVLEGVSYVREAALARGERIDFLCAGGIGLELKIKGAPSEVLRQLQRYAASDAIRELVLATSRVQHHALLGGQRSCGGKPLRLVRVSGGLL